jgi:hypothetical protein
LAAHYTLKFFGDYPEVYHEYNNSVMIMLKQYNDSVTQRPAVLESNSHGVGE